MKHVILLLSFLLISKFNLVGQIFFENFGNVSGISIEEYNIKYVGNSNISTSTPSNTTRYQSASGGGNLLIKEGEFFEIELDFSCYRNISLNFGFWKSSGRVFGMELNISNQDTSYTIQLGNRENRSCFGSSCWNLESISFIPEGIVTIGFYNNSVRDFRIDDIFIAGDLKNQGINQFCLESDTTIIIDGFPVNIDPYGYYEFILEASDGCDSLLIVVSECPLPIELGRFTVIQEESKNVLEWVTFSEFNNNYFLIQRSYGDNFYDIGKVYGKNLPSKYIYIDYDFDVTKEFIFYRLKQVDFDGYFDYSEIVSIENRVKITETYYINILGQKVVDIEKNTGVYIKIDVYENGDVERKKIYIIK